ncbi:hypothetical protein INH39_21070 [Massilia violaceinigra]|uniref:Uncharacterized protein n=1 Tax=Massilia violaceinigra TaxID=2045208 RepID=A0ABY3ZZQ5_9BURK|nr:hypothetical protein [Massilia violaceinigra]UOD27962.1 hypothetical protein INH39_21070 [Massilia violaceinigra]
MADLTSIEATVGEWRVVLTALEEHMKHLTAMVNTIEDEDEQCEMYGDLERLQRMIPDFKRQFEEGINRII